MFESVVPNSPTLVVRIGYKIGEIRYLKEAWCATKIYDDVAPRDLPEDTEIWWKNSPPLPSYMGKWRSPMFLRECFARDFIQIKDIKIERLQNITEEDAKAEGAVIGDKAYAGCLSQTPLKFAYAALWDSINAKKGHPWSKNEWIAAITFKRVSAESARPVGNGK
jgi:hypothetical protein